MRRIVLIGFAVVLGGCASASHGRTGADSHRAVAAFFPIAATLRALGGPALTVRDLTPPGVEPHDLELTTDEMDSIIDADLVVRVDLAVGKALYLCGQIRECRAFLESALERPGASSTASWAELHVWLARACLRLGANESGLVHVERALKDIGNNVLSRARLFVARAELLQSTNPAAAEKDADRALALLGKRPGLDDELSALSVKGSSALLSGRFTEASAAARRRLELVQKAGRKLDEIPALRCLAEASAAQGDRLGAREHLNGALKLARAANHRVEEALLQKALGDQLFISGAYSEAVARYQSAATLAAETGQTLSRAESL